VTEIDKLRVRLKNVASNIIEYRMTVAEAHALVLEFEELEKKISKKEENHIVEVVKSTPIVHILDGGTF
jgi:hypothetical protein